MNICRAWQMTVVVLMTMSAGCSGFTPVVPGSSPPSSGRGEASGLLMVRTVDLSFENGRAEATVGRNGMLRAKAAVQFDGNGQFRGAWLVDGHVIGLLNMVVSYGRTIYLETGSAAILPAFEPGAHDVSLRIDEPATTLPMPVIRYWVTAN